MKQQYFPHPPPPPPLPAPDDLLEKNSQSFICVRSCEFLVDFSHRQRQRKEPPQFISEDSMESNNLIPLRKNSKEFEKKSLSSTEFQSTVSS